MSLIKKIFPDPLIFYLILALIFAFVFPQLSYINVYTITLSKIINIGVICVFFFYGLKLKWNEVFKDLMNWKLHLRIQLITFLLFPLLGLLFYPLTKVDSSYQMMFLAVFYLCCLPSTVSSSVVMVSIAKGNMISAIFNASLSGLIGIILTPLWMSLFIHQDGEVDSFSIVTDLLLKVVLPVVVGAFLQPYLGKYYDKYKQSLSNVDKFTIVLIVYESFSHTFSEGLLQVFGFKKILVMTIVVILLFFIVFYLIQLLNDKFWKFKREDFIVLQFCGTKKSLVHGSVIGSILFGSEIGFILLPIMIYHTFQLLFISYKASQYAKQVV